MPSTPILMDFRAMSDAQSADRRADRRYPIALQIRYKMMRKGKPNRVGFGRALNISSHGVLFEVDDALPVAGQMEVALNWPFFLQRTCGLQLIMRGHIVRTQNKTIAIKADFHEFRTTRGALFEGLTAIQ